MQESYISAYMRYAGAGVSEPPAIFHRWCSISIIGALLGRQFYFPFGHSRVYPNQYINLMGPPGCRKSSAISIGVKLLARTGFTRFAADRVSKEKFLLDMSVMDEVEDEEDILDMTLDQPAQSFIAADEFTDFIGPGNMEFLTMLTKLWDCPEEYKQPKIHGKDAVVDRPTVNILSGNTPQGFALAFPPEAIGNGFLSRTIFVHGETTGRKVTFPPQPDMQLRDKLEQHLRKIQALVKGEASVSEEAMKLCDRVYQEFIDLEDVRFKSYSTRRFTHLLKLALCLAASELRTTIDKQDIIRANTLLYFTELNMHKALGEYGKSKVSDQANAVMAVLRDAKTPLSATDIWKKVSQEFSKIPELGDVLRNLEHAEKIQQVTIAKKQGFLPLVKRSVVWAEDLIDRNWLTLEEMS